MRILNKVAIGTSGGSGTGRATAELLRKRAMDLVSQKTLGNAVCSGPILADKSSRWLEKIGLTTKECDTRIGSKTFVGRVGEHCEVAAVVLFSASDEANYSTGSQLMVDGGYSAQ